MHRRVTLVIAPSAIFCSTIRLTVTSPRLGGRAPDRREKPQFDARILIVLSFGLTCRRRRWLHRLPPRRRHTCKFKSRITGHSQGQRDPWPRISQLLRFQVHRIYVIHKVSYSCNAPSHSTCNIATSTSCSSCCDIFRGVDKFQSFFHSPLPTAPTMHMTTYS